MQAWEIADQWDVGSCQSHPSVLTPMVRAVDRFRGEETPQRWSVEAMFHVWKKACCALGG